MDNAELKARIDRIAESLEGIEAGFDEMLEEQAFAREREIARGLVRFAPRASPTWPWTPETVTQGFLAGRWLRRDGNSYGAVALRGATGSIAPPRGGDDDQAQVSVPSGAPRA